MAKFTQIELFLPEQYALDIHRIRIVNPQFKALGEVDGNWFSRSSEWSFTGGTGVAQYTDNGFSHQGLYQVFQNPLRNGLWYDVNFRVSGMTQGRLDVYIGTTDRIGSITGDGTYSLQFQALSGSTGLDRLLFQPMNNGTLLGPYFDGAIRGPISISQNTTLSPSEMRTKYEPSGMLDMEDSVRVGMTYRVSDLKQINKRFGAYTKSFRLPGTPNNKRLLSHLQDPNSRPIEGEFDPRYRTKAVIWIDDVSRIYGYLRLKEVVNRGEETWFEVEFYNGQFGLLDEVRGKKLSELNFDSISHLLTAENIVASWGTGNTWQNGYTYPIYLNFEDRFRVRDDFRPAFYNRWILDRIMRDANYSYTMSPEMEEQYNKLLTCPVGKRPEVNASFFASESVSVSATTGQSWSVGARVQISNYDQLPNVYYYDQWQLDAEISDPSDNYNPSSGLWSFVAPYDGTYTFNLTADTTIDMSTLLTDPTPAFPITERQNLIVRFDICDYQSGAVLAATSQFLWEPPDPYSDPTVPYNQNVVFSGTFAVDLVAGQVICTKVMIDHSLLYKQFINGFNIYARPAFSLQINNLNSRLNIVPTGAYQITEGMLVDPSDWVNDVTQEQFIADQIKLYNAFMIPDLRNERKVHITSYSELYDNDLVLDLSGKVAMDDDVVIEPIANVSSSEILLGYKKPIEKDEYNSMYRRLVNEQYGDHTFNNETDHYVNKNESRLAIYTPAPIVRDPAGRYVPGVLSRSQERDMKLLIRSDETLPTELKLSRYVENSASYTTNVYNYYRPCLHIDAITPSAQTFDVNFGRVEKVMTNVDIDITVNNRFRENYLEQLVNYRDGKRITCLMNLSQNDVDYMTTNVGARLFIQELGGWFIWNAIVDFDPTLAEESLTKVELLQVTSSSRRIRLRRIDRVEAGIDLPSPTGLISTYSDITGRAASVFNTNIGFNWINTEGYYNTVVGSGNTVYDNSAYNTIYGDNNTVGAGVSGVTILGGSNIVANNSDTVYINNYGVVSETGMTMFSSFTTNNNITTFYGSSGVTITPEGTSFYGPSGVTITSSGITINGQVFTGDTPMFVQNGNNIVTGGTPYRPTVNIVDDPVFTSVLSTSISAQTISAVTVSATTFISGSTNLSSLLNSRYDHPYVSTITDLGLTNLNCMVGVDVRYGPITITLPKLVDIPNWYFVIKDTKSIASLNNITINTNPGDTIVETSTGVASISITNNGGCVTLFSTPDEWWVTSRL